MQKDDEEGPLRAIGLLDLDILNQHIKKSGYTKQELATHLGIDRGTLRHYLHGDTSMPLSVRTHIFQLLGYSPSDVATPLQSTRRESMVQWKQGEEPREEIDLFNLKAQIIHALIRQWYGRGTYCEQLQVLIRREIHMLDLMQSFYPPDTYSVSRRQFLATLAASPLLLRQRKGITQKLHPEEWLPHCTASITACWHLLNGDDLCLIEQTLRVYLPTLLQLAGQASRYQKTAAALAAQGCLLQDLASYHRTQFQDSLSYAHEAVRLAEIAGDPNLIVYVLLLEGGAYNLNQQPVKMLQQHQKAMSERLTVFPALRSYVYAQLAYASAQNGQSEEAYTAIQQARVQFPDHFGVVPCYIEIDYNQPQLILFEALTFLSIGTHTRKREPYKQAAGVLEKAETIPESSIPLRSRVELVNYQAQAAIGRGDLDAFEHYSLAGLQGAHALQSQKRQDEIRANCQMAKSTWPNENRIHLLECQLHETWE